MAHTETAREKKERLRRYDESKTILTLDLGAAYGMAISKNGKFHHSSNCHLEGSKGKKYHIFRYNLEDCVVELNPAFIAYEKVQRHTGTYAAQAYGYYEGTLTALAYACNIPIVTMEVGEIKEFIAGKYRADKQMVIDAVNARGHSITDDNEADAVAMLYLQLSKMENV